MGRAEPRPTKLKIDRPGRVAAHHVKNGGPAHRCLPMTCPEQLLTSSSVAGAHVPVPQLGAETNKTTAAQQGLPSSQIRRPRWK